jgi:hypothetical protein
MVRVGSLKYNKLGVKLWANAHIYILIVICIMFFVFKIPFWSHYPMWDETVYLGMGKYIYSAGSSGLWEMIRPLGLPAITGLWWSLGLDQMVVSRIVGVLFSLGIIMMVYLIAKKLFDKNEKIAIIAALIMAITPIFFFYSDYVMTDHVSTLAVLISIYFIMNNKYILGGIFGGLAFWFKFTHILFIGILGIYILYKFCIRNGKLQCDGKYLRKNYHSILKSKELYSLIIMILMILAYFLSNYILYHQHLGTIDAILRPYTDAAAYSDNPYQNTYFSNVQEFFYYIFYYLYNIIFHAAYGNILYIFFLIYLVRLKLENFLRDKKHVLIFITFIIYLAYFSAIPYKNERFWIFVLPFLAIYASYGIIWCHESLKKISKKQGKVLSKTLNVFFILLILIITGYIISKDVDFYAWDYHFREPNMLVEKYFDIHNIDGPILTDDPRFTAYSDKLYIPAYDILNRNGLFLNDWESQIDFNAAVYNDKSIPCLEYDQKCIDNRQKIIDMLASDFKALDTYYYNGANITFYIRK